MGKRSFSIHEMPFLDICPQSFDSLVRTVTMDALTMPMTRLSVWGTEHLIYHTCFVPGIYIPDSFRRIRSASGRNLWKRNITVFKYIWKMFLTLHMRIIRIVDAVGHPDFQPALISPRHANSPIPSGGVDWSHGGQRLGMSIYIIMMDRKMNTRLSIKGRSPWNVY